jgi:hypothetical protein
MRGRVLQRRSGDLDAARAQLSRMREQGKWYFPRRHHIRAEPLLPGMLELTHDTLGCMDMSSRKNLIEEPIHWLSLGGGRNSTPSPEIA